MNASGISEGLIALTPENNPSPDGRSGPIVESSQEATTDGAIEFATEIYERYLQSCANIPGWFFPVSVAIWDTLLSYQAENNIRGNLMEIGVFKGKSATMAALHSHANETCVLVDPMPLDEVRQRIEHLAPEAQCHYLQEMSQYLLRYPFLTEAARDFRWIHIDGEHTAQAVSNDLSIAETLLSDRGILALDDFFSPCYPQITLALFRFLEANPGRLALILCGYNKGYLCRPKAAREYLTFIRSSLYPNLAKRNCQRVTVCKTTGRHEHFRSNRAVQRHGLSRTRLGPAEYLYLSLAHPREVLPVFTPDRVNECNRDLTPIETIRIGLWPG
jgi:Methyltransferase domain